MFRTAPLALAVVTVCGSLNAQEPCMMRGIGWRTDAIFTIGNTVNGYLPVGIPDGMGAFVNPDQEGTILLTVNHELNPGNGLPYTLANGTSLTGARISTFVVSRNADGSGQADDGEMSFTRMIDRQGNEVTDPAQVNETGNSIDGLARFCSGVGIRGGQYDFVEDIHICGEETGFPFHPHGGSVWVLDVDTNTLYAAPDLGRGAWENVTPIDSGDPQTVALLLGDDTGGAPMYLYVGVKQGTDFLGRNGLRGGQVYFWKADNGDTTPAQFNTAGSVRTGTWEAYSVQDPSLAGSVVTGLGGHDIQGYKNGNTQRSEIEALGGFRFSRPEDLSTNPANGSQAVFASTGRSSLFPADTWGTTLLIDTNVQALTATFTILNDADNEAVPDAGIRSPDNLVWADNGQIYIQEDRSTGLFGQTTGEEASIWELNPANGAKTRVGQINRSVLLPLGVTDSDVGQIGAWESSGIIDVTSLFDTAPGETLLLGNVQGHGLEDGPIGGNANLDEGGQLFFMSNVGIDHAVQALPTPAGSEVRFDVTNGSAGNGYAVVLAFQNAGSAPNGYFFGVAPAFDEFQFLVAPLVGMLDAFGESSFGLPLPGLNAPFGFVFDTVAIELGSNGTPAQSGPAVTVNL